MHGITLTSAPMDWEILQQEGGSARIHLAGSYHVHPAAIQVEGSSMGLRAGDQLTLTFSGNVCHIFGQDGKNLEF